ncbi:thiosulfate sulfurtransferase [Azorhizobium oxalatiphilum]|uniref:3-mercaptopyruvate sulfurtransferase n=1 Tax=Azorhizobium oxalatiphilum TaxID=980631 RepID=A0A917BSW7_9HYPH|nr:3-mercaptopyruvate sulfurtransferase [Azorhizobium oxalatiphilum]GGF55615.1 thiosulfate sulfurtransferase [Azorhizobium oxalatiphilum]
MTAPLFVSTEWLAGQLGQPDLVVVDASWYLPAAGRNGKAEYLERHVPGAVFFDLDGISDPNTDLPHMLPSAEAFAAAVGALGISESKRIVVYDGAGLFSAPRVWWTFKVFGASDVLLLEGGLPAWIAEGRPTEAGAASPAPASFKATLNAAMVADIGRVEQTLADRSAQVLDARPNDRFSGSVPELRPGIPSGHMPGALNLPSSKVVRSGAIIPENELRAALDTSGVDLDRPVITSCGSGVTAAILWVALESIGKTPLALYDGSWTEWGSSGKPVVTDAG